MTVQQTVVETLRTAPFSLTPAEIADRCEGTNRHSIRRAVRELLATGAVVTSSTLGNSNTYKLA